VWLVVDVQPFAACCRSLIHQCPDQLPTDAMPPVGTVDDGVEHERVRPAVPTGIHKADQGVAFESTDPGQAVMLETLGPWLGSAGPIAKGASVRSDSTSSSIGNRTLSSTSPITVPSNGCL
jgi:hypothetical protein